MDGSITLAINSLHFESGDYFWQFFSLKESWYPLYLIVLILTVKSLGWKKGGIMVLAMALTIVACDQFANLIKDGVGRLRPCYNESLLSGGLHVLEGRGSFFGFFSAHAANAFGFATASSIALKMDKNHRYQRYQWFIFIWAALIGLSRVFAGKHFMGDVLVGTIVGLVFGWCIARAAGRLTEKV
ncbi:MAG: phosphatase PAP2 family protein [Bacteroidia bacterium]|nr:phosphatase PAP2 family protein [Bacteroidia bacterium]